MRKIGFMEVRAVLLDILDPQTGDVWGPRDRKVEYLTHAIFTLGEFRERRALPRLKEILKNSGDGMRNRAILALGKIDADGVKDLLYPMLLTLDPHDFGMQWALVTALARNVRECLSSERWSAANWLLGL